MRTLHNAGKSKLEIPASWETAEKRISQALKQEAFDVWKDNAGIYTKRGFNIDPKSDNVIRVLGFPEVSPNGKVEMIKDFGYSHNLVTNDGDIYYAKQGAGEAITADEDFSDAAAGFEIGTVAVTEVKADTYTEFSAPAGNPITGSNKAYTTGYPKTNDTGDVDNTGDAVDAVSFAVNYTAGDWNDTTVEQGVIFDDLATPSAGAQLLTHFSFTLFAKTASDTLKIFVNHTMNGV